MRRYRIVSQERVCDGERKMRWSFQYTSRFLFITFWTFGPYHYWCGTKEEAESYMNKNKNGFKGHGKLHVVYVTGSEVTAPEDQMSIEELKELLKNKEAEKEKRRQLLEKE